MSILYILIAACLIYAGYEYYLGAKEHGTWKWFFQKDETPRLK